MISSLDEDDKKMMKNKKKSLMKRDEGKEEMELKMMIFKKY